MNAPDFHVVLADIRADQTYQDAVEEAARQSNEAHVTELVNKAKARAWRVYQELAEALAFGPQQVYEDDVVVLLAAIRSLIIKRSEAMHDERFYSAVESIEDAIDILSVDIEPTSDEDFRDDAREEQAIERWRELKAEGGL